MKKESYKNAVQKINLSQEKKVEIYEKIKEYSNKRTYFKPILLTTFVFIFVLLGMLGTVYAEEIKEAINTIFIRKINNEHAHQTDLKGNILAEINYEADIAEASPKTLDEKRTGNLNSYYTYEELETKLGIPLLKSDYFKRKNFYQELTEKMEGKITRASFSMENFKDTKEKLDGNHTFYISLETKYWQDKNNHIFGISGAFKEEQYYIHSLDTTAYIFKYHDGYRNQQWEVLVIYQNIIYRFEFNFYRKDLNSMWEEATQILDSLYL